MKSLQNIEHPWSLGLKNARLQNLGFIFHLLSLLVLVVNHEEGEGAGVCGMS